MTTDFQALPVDFTAATPLPSAAPTTNVADLEYLSAFREMCADLTDSHDLVVLLLVRFSAASDGTVDTQIYSQPLVPQRIAGGEKWENGWKEIVRLLGEEWLPAGSLLLNKEPVRMRKAYFAPFERNEYVRALLSEAMNRVVGGACAQMGLPTIEWGTCVGTHPKVSA